MNIIDNGFIIGASFGLDGIKKELVQKDYYEIHELDARLHRDPTVNYMMEVILKGCRVVDDFEIFDVDILPKDVTVEDDTKDLQFVVMIRTSQYISGDQVNAIMQEVLYRYKDRPDQM